MIRAHRFKFVPSWLLHLWQTPWPSRAKRRTPTASEAAVEHVDPLTPRLAYWRSSLDPRPVPRFFGQATSLEAAMKACEVAHGGLLAWQEVDWGHYTARSGDLVYTVRFEN
ncbi:hypothetical protein [Deinococcus yavapaiensis]|uniref:Uncharacterized protein n=1 Tax=Deinococcus yavapaiensis KR-236 TaxID=694435 RepID=A0A318SAD5_9DEIO|nr:hypothetical protein [Deinococcus yavapaiensis]PYE55030.1 hypothetical protein DES52_104305 [Deinococcus yavapaiensis KR-236]